MIVSDYDNGISFMELLNARRESINVTFKICNTEAQFLDLTLYKTKPDQIAVKSYIKPMNKHLFIPPTSCHPPHVFKGWIVGYGRRLRGSNTADHHYKSFIDLFESCLINRGYKKKSITEHFTFIPDRKTVLDSILNKPNAPKKDIGTPFVVTYTPAIQASLPAIKNAIAITEEARLDPHYPMIFTARTTPLLSFKRGRNLRDLVSPSALPK